MPSGSLIKIEENAPLAPLTTIKLGGQARFFARCATVDELREAIKFAGSKQLKVHILGGGSNTIFSDAGFNGLVIKIEIGGITYVECGGKVKVTAGAGVVWDELVSECVGRGLGGLESLSGIPGTVGATPVQNVGAYGYAVSDLIVSVKVLDRRSLAEKSFTNKQCSFGYRQSRFKGKDADRYVMTGVTFGLKKNAVPVINYPGIVEQLGGKEAVAKLTGDTASLRLVREATLTVRRRKSMVLDEADSNTRSCGSFFVNPVLKKSVFRKLRSRLGTEVPVFPVSEGVKIPAAWFLERVGFRKGYVTGKVGISTAHNLALINRGGTAEELLDLASKIRETVREKFGVELEQEPVLVPK